MGTHWGRAVQNRKLGRRMLAEWGPGAQPMPAKFVKLRIHLANVWPNKSKRVYTNACCAFATAVSTFPLSSTCDKDMPITNMFVRHSSGISFVIRSFITYPANIGEWRTNVRSCLLQSPHLVNTHVRSCLAKHIHQVYMQL